MKTEPTLNGFTHQFLAELFAYDPETGVVTRRTTRAANAQAGSAVGSLDSKGYLHVNVLGKFIRLHRLAFFLHTKQVPPEVDHENNTRTDNRIRNLRPATRQQNAGNCGAMPGNTSGFKGVSLNSRSGKWHAQIKINGKQTYLGRFDDPVEAAQCYDSAARAHFGEFAKVNDA